VPRMHCRSWRGCSRWRWGAGVNGRAVPRRICTCSAGGLNVSATCKASPGGRCVTSTGREAAQVHIARLRPTRGELVWRPAVREELERRGATVAIVPFSGWAGRSGRTDTIKLLWSVGEELIDVDRWTSRDELCYALEAPVWDCFGTFIGHPQVRGEIVWSAENRCVVIRGRRGDRQFEELAG
jgi:hypothetical protein